MNCYIPKWMRKAAGPSREWLRKAADIEDSVRSVAAGCFPPEPVARLCGTCRHWKEAKGEGGSYFGECWRIIHDVHRDCEGPPNGMDSGILCHKAVVIDGSGYAAALRTQDDFGCVLWEPREEPASPEES